MLDKSFKGDLQSQIHTVDAASNTTTNTCLKRTAVYKVIHLAFALHFFIYLSHALFMQRTTLSILSRSYSYCVIRTNRAFHISMIVKENLLNVMEHFFFYSVFSRIISQKLLAFSSWKYSIFWIFLRYLYRFFPHPHSKLRHF